MKPQGGDPVKAPVVVPAKSGSSSCNEPKSTSRREDEVKEKVITISGGTSGIGLAVTRILVNQGARVALGG